MSDNGPQYASDSFADFARQWNFANVTSFPLKRNSNVLAEPTVKTIKRLFQKAKDSGMTHILQF